MKKIILFSIASILQLLNVCFATHIKGGEITVKNLGSGSIYEVTLNLYLDSTSVVHSGGVLDENEAVINFGDGTFTNTPSVSRTAIGSNTIKVTFVATHEYTGNARDYMVSYEQTNRNKYIVNINGKDGLSTDLVPFFIQTFIRTGNVGGFISTAQFSSYTDLTIQAGTKLSYKIPAVAGDMSDSLAFSLVTPRISIEKEVPAYVSPDDASFGGTAETGGPAIISVDPKTGLLVWDAPSTYMASGINYAFYNIGLKVATYRKNLNNTYELVAHTTRDQLIKVVPKVTGLQISLKEDFNIFPIPVSTSLNIQSKSAYHAGFKIKINNINGQLVEEFIMPSPNYISNIEHLAPGMYEIQISQGNQVWSDKLIKE